MKIIVLNGSPKGEKSVSLFYARYLMEKFKEVEFQQIPIAQRIKKLEKNTVYFAEVCTEIEKADAVLWVFPVYVMSVPAQIIRFYELLEERRCSGVFKEKYISSLLTSMHFFDHTSQDYLRAISEDLEAQYVDGFTAEMFDLQKEEVRQNLTHFATQFFRYVENKFPTQHRYHKNQLRESSPFDFVGTEQSTHKTNPKGKTLMVTNATAESHNLNEMIKCFKASYGEDIDTINVNEIEMKGSCLGCLQCSRSGECVYKDEFTTLKPIIQNCRATVYALDIQGRSYGAKWKTYMDRNFSNGHRIKSLFNTAFLIAGDFSYQTNIQAITEGLIQGGSSGFEGNIVTDEHPNNELTSKLIETLSNNLKESIKLDYRKPANFFGVAAHKIFRDLIYNTNSFQAEDHKYYKKEGLYDFPTTDYKMRLTNFIIKNITRVPSIKEKFNSKINDMMLLNLQKVIDQEKREDS